MASGAANVGNNRLTGGIVHVGHGDLCALARQRARTRRPNAARAARYDGHLVVDLAQWLSPSLTAAGSLLTVDKVAFTGSAPKAIVSPAGCKRRGRAAGIP